MQNKRSKVDVKRIVRGGGDLEDIGQISVGLMSTVSLADIQEPTRVISRLKAHIEEIVGELRTVGVLTSGDLMQIGLATCAEIAANLSGLVEDRDRLKAAEILIDAAGKLPKEEEPVTVNDVKGEIVQKLRSLLEKK